MTFVREKRLGARYAVPRTRPPRYRRCGNGAEIAYNRPRPRLVFRGCKRGPETGFRGASVAPQPGIALPPGSLRWLRERTVKRRWSRRRACRGASPTRLILRPPKPLLGCSRRSSAFGFRRRGRRRPPFSSSRRRSTGRATRCNPGGPDLEPRACIHPREYLCEATACRGSAVVPKRTKTSRFPAQGAFYPGSRIQTSENTPSTHSGE
jgi:hypothetical protein